MVIYIPTRGRANNQETFKWFPKSMHDQIVMVIDEDERELYDQYPCPKLIIPEDVKGISAKRKIIVENAQDKKIVMLDDDLRFYIRKAHNDWHLRYLEPEEYPALFGLLDKWLDEYAHCGISAREGNNRVEDLAVENTRYMRVLAYNLDMMKDIEFGRTEVMEDFDIALELLKKGMPSKVSFYYAQGQKSSNAEGGCSEWRTIDTHNQGAELLASLHPECVKLVEKQTKTAWNGLPRKDVIVGWKKAYQEGVSNAGSLF